MDNIINYIDKLGNKRFSEMEFNEVDSLVMCSLSYQIFDKHVPLLNTNKRKKEKGIMFKDLVEDQNILFEMIEPTLIPPTSKKFINSFINSERFNNVKINYFCSVFDDVTQTQFAAMVFELDDNINYIAFRGTDTTILGWKEDFNMALLDEIPSQTHAVNYLNQVIPHLKGTIYVGGHSKGGNLARFGSIFVSSKYQKRINKIFDHDGPGIQRDLSNNPRFLKIKDKIYKTIPYDSLIGILLNHDNDYKIVKAKYASLLQHDQYNWYVDIDKHDFVYQKNSSLTCQVNDEAINKWINEIPPDKRKIFIECVFDIFKKAEITTVHQIAVFPITKFYRALFTIDNFSKEEKKTLFQLTLSFIKTWLKTFRLKLKSEMNKKKNIK